MTAFLYFLARLFWRVGLRDLGGRLAARAWLRDLRDRGGPTVRD